MLNEKNAEELIVLICPTYSVKKSTKECFKVIKRLNLQPHKRSPFLRI